MGQGVPVVGRYGVNQKAKTQTCGRPGRAGSILRPHTQGSLGQASHPPPMPQQALTTNGDNAPTLWAQKCFSALCLLPDNMQISPPTPKAPPLSPHTHWLMQSSGGTFEAGGLTSTVMWIRKVRTVRAQLPRLSTALFGPGSLRFNYCNSNSCKHSSTLTLSQPPCSALPYTNAVSRHNNPAIQILVSSP